MFAKSFIFLLDDKKPTLCLSMGCFLCHRSSYACIIERISIILYGFLLNVLDMGSIINILAIYLAVSFEVKNCPIFFLSILLFSPIYLSVFLTICSSISHKPFSQANLNYTMFSVLHEKDILYQRCKSDHMLS